MHLGASIFSLTGLAGPGQQYGIHVSINMHFADDAMPCACWTEYPLM